jgi:hypothetical protein
VIRALDFASTVKRKFTFVPPKPNFAVMPQLITASQSRRAFGLTPVPETEASIPLTAPFVGTPFGSEEGFFKGKHKAE